jgi:hypothetical protein
MQRFPQSLKSVRIIVFAFWFDGGVPKAADRGAQTLYGLVSNPEGFRQSMFQGFALGIEGTWAVAMTTFPDPEETKTKFLHWRRKLHPAFSLAVFRPAYFAFSEPTSDAFLSSRKPKKTGWRNRSSLVHSVNFTSHITTGLTQTHRFIPAAVNPGSRPRPCAGRLSNGQSLTALVKFSRKEFQEFFAEAGSDPASKFKFAALIYADQQRTQMLPFAARLSIAADHK